GAKRKLRRAAGFLSGRENWRRRTGGTAARRRFRGELNMRFRRSHTVALAPFLALGFSSFFATGARCDAPAWMHNLVNAPVPTHDEKTDAVVLYSEEVLNVQSADRVKHTIRKAYKILRPNGREHGVVVVPFNQRSKVTGMHGWCIPAQGKDFEVKAKDAMEISLPKIAGSELISDVKDKIFEIPAADPGNIVGFEYE